MNAQVEARPCVLEVEGIDKAYIGVHALKGVDLRVHAGSIHGLVGQNGAGKSTLVKMLSGAEMPDRGIIRVGGVVRTIRRPTDARAAGIFTIYQELSLVPSLSVAENIFLGKLPVQGPLRWVAWRQMRALARGALERVGFEDIPVGRTVGSLPVAEQQAVELAKALYQEAKVVLLDEPTSALPGPDVESLFALLRRLAAQGQALLFISHRLDEVHDLCNEISVLRDGELIADLAAAECTQADIVRAMIGEKLEKSISAAALQGEKAPRLGSGPKEEIILTGAGLSDANRVHGVDISLRRGEVLGIAGLVGSGQSELAGMLAGAKPRVQGNVSWKGRPVRINGPRDAIRLGIGLLPQDRKAEGFVPDLSVAENMTLASHDAFSRGGVLDTKREASVAREMVHRLGMKVFGVGQSMKTLSGGTQQKGILARWLVREAELLICDEPTRGVDVGAKEDMYELLRAFSASGGSVIIASSEISEALMCDRVLVLKNGTLVAELDHDEIDARGQAILDAFAGSPHDQLVPADLGSPIGVSE
ncbi:MAG: sugar ABC transporter ATP-binding protein [Propionibacteriaceae bacterium]